MWETSNSAGRRAGGVRARPGCRLRTGRAWTSRRSPPCGRRGGDAGRQAAWCAAAPDFPQVAKREGRAGRVLRTSLGQWPVARLSLTPLCRGNLRDSGAGYRHLYSFGAAVARRLSRGPCPLRSFVPERFRGPVAPSAAGGVGLLLFRVGNWTLVECRQNAPGSRIILRCGKKLAWSRPFLHPGPRW